MREPYEGPPGEVFPFEMGDAQTRNWGTYPHATQRGGWCNVVMVECAL